jgi:Ribbon-helix-helix protein, copG family
MTQLVIDDLEDEVVAVLDESAAKRGLSRAELAKRLLAQALAPMFPGGGQESCLADHLLSLHDPGFDFEPKRSRAINPRRLVTFE